MLSEERYARIMETLRRKQSVTVAELSRSIGVSESTVRRDLNLLHKKKKLSKIFGGATSRELVIQSEEEITIKKSRFQEEKHRIGRYAASFISDGDSIFLCPGSTVECMIEYIEAKNLIFVTNSPGHNYQLVRKGFRSLLTGGELNIYSDSLVGSDTLMFLQKFNFNKGFFGVNAVSLEGGYSSYFPAESAILRAVIKQCHSSYILADTSKFNAISTVKVADLADAAIITNVLPNGNYREYTEVFESDRA